MSVSIAETRRLHRSRHYVLTGTALPLSLNGLTRPVSRGLHSSTFQLNLSCF
jgi:hypothetical protein